MIQLLPILTAAGTALRVPALAAFFAGLAGEIVALFAKWFTRRTAIQLGIVASVVALATALFATIELSIASISVVMPSYVRQGLDMCIPANFAPCVSLVLGAKVVRWVWIWKVHFIEMYANGGN